MTLSKNVVQEGSINLRVSGIEVTIYYKVVARSSSKSCAYCGKVEGPVFEQSVEMVDVVAEDNSTVSKKANLYKACDVAIKAWTLHGHPCCVNEECESKFEDALLNHERTEY